MTEKSVPAPALSSDALDKSRRNTLFWSALAVASELAQTVKHEIKSSVIGTDAALPVTLVSLIFVLLAGFHFYAFWVEKRRIERWQSKYAREHPGITLREKITALYEQLPGLLLRVNEDNHSVLKIADRMNSIIEQLAQQSSRVISYYQALASRERELAEAMRTASHIDDSGPQGVLSKWYESTKKPDLLVIDFALLSYETNHLRIALTRESGPDSELQAKLDKITKDLSSLADDIDVGERRYFYLYEVGAPVAAFSFAAIFWAASFAIPNLPIDIRAIFH